MIVQSTARLKRETSSSDVFAELPYTARAFGCNEGSKFSVWSDNWFDALSSFNRALDNNYSMNRTAPDDSHHASRAA